MKATKIGAFLLACCLSAADAQVATNLLVNGDFTTPASGNEDDRMSKTPPGWTNVGSTETGVIAFAYTNMPVYKRPGYPDTVNYYDLGGLGRGIAQVGDGVSQTFTTVPGRQYLLKFAFSSEFGCRADPVQDNITNVSVGSLNVNLPVPYVPTATCASNTYEPDAYQKPFVPKSFTFTASGTSTTLKFTTVAADLEGTNDPLITAVEVLEINPTLTVKKLLGGSGRINAADQFTVQIKDAGNAVVNDTSNSTTTGNGTQVTTGKGTTGATILTAGATYSLAEVMAPGSVSPLAYYSAKVVCHNDNTSGTNVSTITSLSNPVVLAAGDVVTCDITNTPAPPGGIMGKVFADVGRASGVANDGVLNGGEQPIAGVAVQLTNCSGTVYGQSLTDGQGTYSFNTPNVAVGAPLCVVQTNAAGHVSTGASVGNTALPSGSPVSISGTTYTYNRPTDQIAFTWNGTGHSDLNFGDVPQGTLVANGNRTAAPGTTTTYAHTFTAGSAGTVVFSISASTASPSLNGWSERVFLDEGCSGSYQSGATPIYPPVGAGINVVAQQKVCVIVQQYVPATAPVGYKNEATLQASFNYSNASPSLSSSYTATDTTVVDNASLSLFKEVRNITQNGSFGANNQAKSGDVLEYRITYTNTAPAVLSNLTIHDTTPAFTSYVSSTVGNTPATLTACAKNTPANPPPSAGVACSSAQSAGGTGAVIWRFTGSLPGSASGQVLFQVKVD